MTVQADHSGIVRGKFAVPANIPAGIKLVEFIGDRGTRGLGQFIGRGTITVEERRLVTVVERYDPLAQTFTLLTEGRHIAGVGLWFADIGTKPVTVQIRTTATGLPTGTVLASTRLNADQLNRDGETVFNFPVPLWLEALQEYAIVVLTDDAQHSIWIAEVGQYDRHQQRYVTEQGYTVGVMLSSSNASTWTPHNNADLSFRLYGAEFTSTEKHFPLNELVCNNASDLYLMAEVERTGAETDVQFIFTGADEKTYRLQDRQSAQLDERTTGTLQSAVNLLGSATRSPIVYPSALVALGDVQESATYVSRAIPAGAGKAIVILETHVPQGAAIKVELEIDGQWQECTATNGEPLGEGWLRQEYSRPISGGDTVRCRLTLTGNISARPRARQLRMMSIR